jgi:4-hydroxy-4-methyl-2-oxoglutarate aldolase
LQSEEKKETKMENTYIGMVGFRYRAEITRPALERVNMLTAYSTCNIADGMQKMYTMDSGIKAVCPTKKICGPAVTVRISLGDNLMLHKALSLVQPGDILVVDAQGCTTFSACGGIMMLRMKKLGVQGIVVDGAVRDIEDIREIGLPVYARAIVPQGGGKGGPGEINFPVACGGVAVMPGDVIAADDNGIVCVRQDDIEKVAAGVEAKLEKEKSSFAEIKAGKLVKSDIDELLAKKGIV